MTLRPGYQVADMAQPDTGKGSFFGRFVYERIVPQDHFPVALEHLFDWQGISEQRIGAYRGRGLYGRLPYDPAQIFKMLFISYLYGVSEREVEQLVNYHLVAKWFVGLAVAEPAPDHSTLTVFKCPIRGTGIASSKRMAGRSWLAVSIIFSSKPENKAWKWATSRSWTVCIPKPM